MSHDHADIARTRRGSSAISALIRRLAVGRIHLLLGVVLTGLVLAQSASAAAPQDTVIATGSSEPLSPPIVTRFGDVSVSSLDIIARSGTSGLNPSGTASFSLGELTFSGPVTCLQVTGPDRGSGTAAAPTTAVLSFRDSLTGFLFTAELMDNGGNGTDTISFAAGLTPALGCFVTDVIGTPETGTLTHGRAVVFDAPPSPTSKGQCMDGGWQNFPKFKNQGDCVSFVATQGKNQPG